MDNIIFDRLFGLPDWSDSHFGNFLRAVVWAMVNRAKEILEKAARRAARVQQTLSPEAEVSPRPGFLRNGACVEFIGLVILFGAVFFFGFPKPKKTNKLCIMGPPKPFCISAGALVPVLIGWKHVRSTSAPFWLDNYLSEHFPLWWIMFQKKVILSWASNLQKLWYVIYQHKPMTASGLLSRIHQKRSKRKGTKSLRKQAGGHPHTGHLPIIFFQLLSIHGPTLTNWDPRHGFDSHFLLPVKVRSKYGTNVGVEH